MSRLKVWDAGTAAWQYVTAGAARLTELLDVAVSSPADGEVLTYNSGTSKWGNEAAGAGSSTVQTATKHVTSAQLLDLFANPVNVIAAPGAGKVILPITGLAVFRSGITPYTLPLYDGDPPSFALEVLPAFMGVSLSMPLDSSVDAAATLWMSYSIEQFPLTSIENKPLVFHVTHGNATDGDGTLDFVVHYIEAVLP